MRVCVCVLCVYTEYSLSGPAVVVVISLVRAFFLCSSSSFLLHTMHYPGLCSPSWGDIGWRCVTLWPCRFCRDLFFRTSFLSSKVLDRGLRYRTQENTHTYTHTHALLSTQDKGRREKNTSPLHYHKSVSATCCGPVSRGLHC